MGIRKTGSWCCSLELSACVTVSPQDYTLILAQSVDKGEYSEALASLLDINVLQGMSMAEYHRWSTVVWSILQRQASMR